VDPLERTLEAHGGRAAWQAAREIVARARSGGFALASRGRARAFRACTVRVSTAEPRAVIEPYGGGGRRGVFLGDRVRLETTAGALLAERRAPRAAFAGWRRALWWDRLDALYFGGYALWNYLTTPWLLVRPGVTVDEAGPWSEDGHAWQRLRVRFPPDVPTHSREQVFYVDAAGLLRRHDYTAEVFGSWATAAHYCHAHRRFDGLVLPTRRRVLPRARSGRRRPFPTLVWIDLDAVTVVR